MQSILLATPNKASKLEISSEKKLSGDAITSQGKTDDGKKAKGFASILDQTVSEKKEQDSKVSKTKSSEKNADSKKETSDSELISKSLATKEASKAEKITPLLADSHQEADTAQKGSKIEVSSIQSKADLNVNGNSEESLKVESQTGKPQNTDDVFIEPEADANTASPKMNKENIVATLSVDKTQAVNSDDNIISPVQAQSIKESSKNDGESQTKSISLSNEPLSIVTSSQNKDFSKSESESSAVIDETKQIDSSANTKQLDETHQTLNQGIEPEEKLQSIDASSISNEVLSSNAADISADKDAKQAKEQNTTDSSGEASQADSQLLKQSETAISDALAVNTKTQSSENSEESLEETELVEGTPKTDLPLAKDIPSEIEDPSNTSGQKNISDIDVSPTVTANKQVAEESIEIDTSAENSESDKQNLTKVSEQANQLENNNLNENKAIDANEYEAEVLPTESVNKLSNEQKEEQTPETVVGSVSTSNAQTRVVNENSEQLDEQAPPESEEQEIYALSESDEQVSEQFINPILAQIQTAQSTDTKVINNKTQALGISNVDKDGKKGDKASAQDFAKTLSKVNTTNIENVVAESTAESLATEKELINKANLSANEKIEGMLANFRAEASKPVFNQSTDSHSLNSLGVASASADKLLNQTQVGITNQVLQSSLQQPLELQSKQAAAMVGERIMMMLNQGKQEVTIRLDPAELGSMHIKMQVQQEQLHVAIQTQVGQSRDIIEQNLPRLREQLAQQGINLGEASVEQQSKQNQSNSQGSSHSAGSAQGSNNLGEGFVEEQSEFFPTQIPLSAQGIDYYA